MKITENLRCYKFEKLKSQYKFKKLKKLQTRHFDSALILNSNIN